MSESVSKVGTGYVAPSPERQEVLDMPIEQLEAQIQAAANPVQENVQTHPIPEQQAVTVPPQIPVSGQETQVETKPPEAQAVVSETVPGEPVTFDSLQKKIGIKNPDALANSYSNAVKELQKLKREEAERNKTVQTQPVIPQESHVNSDFLNQFLEKPEEVLVKSVLKISELANTDLREKNAEFERKLKFNEMASTPETSDFVSPEIQAQMQEEYKQRPEWLRDQTTVNANIENAYWISKGKVAKKLELKILEEGRRQGQQSVSQKKAGLVESAGSVLPPQTSGTDTNPKTMPLPDLERLLQNYMKV